MQHIKKLLKYHLLYIIIDISPKNQRKYHITKYTDQMYNFKFFQKSIKMHAKIFLIIFTRFQNLLRQIGYSKGRVFLNGNCIGNPKMQTVKVKHAYFSGYDIIIIS